MIEVHDLGVRIDQTPLLDQVSLSVVPGAWLAVIGPNGAGKSTLLRSVAGLIAYTGRILLDGADLQTLPRRQLARQLAMMTQQPAVPTGMRVADYVLLGRAPYLGMLHREGAHDRRRVAETLARLDLGAFAVRALQTLSGGELQRVHLARALVQEPAVLLLDEPTAALDIGHQQEVLGLIDDIRAQTGLTVISSLHDLTLAGAYADRIVLLDRGRSLREGTPEEVLTADLLGRAYRATVEVLPARPGCRGPVVVPVRADPRQHPGRYR